MEKPIFHPGQLLTADSLKLGAAYIEQRLALRRYIDGVGIVCGLHVRCHPTEPGQVIIDPGYAVDCCGNDIVLCEPTCVDICKCIADCKDDPTASDDAPFTLRLEHMFEERDPVPVVVGHGACGRESGCRPSRLKGRVRLCVERSPQTEHRDVTGEFRSIGTELWERVTRDAPLGNVTKRPSPDPSPSAVAVAREVANKLQLEIADRPPSTYCNLRPYLTAALEVLSRECDTPSNLQREATETVLRVFGAVVDDRRQTYLRRTCEDCCIHPGVSIAEFYVSTAVEVCETATCSIAAIDTQAPARETLHPRDAWWQRDKVSLYDMYYHGVGEACVVLGQRGLTVKCSEIPARVRDYSKRDVSLFAPIEVRPFIADWLNSWSVAGEPGRLSVYCNSALYTECGATVRLWTIRDRIVSIEVEDEGDCGRSRTAVPSSPFKMFLDATLNPSDGVALIANARDLAPCDDEQQSPDPLDRMIQGIGHKLEAHFFRNGIVSLRQLRAQPYSRIRQLASRVKRGFERTQWDRWSAQADSLLANPSVVKRLRLRYQAETRRRYDDAMAEAPVDSLSTMLSGVGKKMEAALFREGIRTIEQFRSASVDTIRSVAAETKRGFATKHYKEWIAQADSLIADQDVLRDIRERTSADAQRRFDALRERP